MPTIDIRISAKDQQSLDEFLHLCGIIELTSNNKKQTSIQLNIDHENWTQVHFKVLSSDTEV